MKKQVRVYVSEDLYAIVSEISKVLALEKSKVMGMALKFGLEEILCRFPEVARRIETDMGQVETNIRQTKTRTGQSEETQFSDEEYTDSNTNHPSPEEPNQASMGQSKTSAGQDEPEEIEVDEDDTRFIQRLIGDDEDEEIVL